MKVQQIINSRPKATKKQIYATKTVSSYAIFIALSSFHHYRNIHGYVLVIFSIQFLYKKQEQNVLAVQSVSAVPVI